MHMQLSPQVLKAGLALGIVLWFGCGASAGPKEDVATATLEWARVLGQDDPDKVLPLYSEDAVLWGALSPTVRADRAALRDYFVTAFRVLPGLKVAFGDELIRVYGGTAVNTGSGTATTAKKHNSRPELFASIRHPPRGETHAPAEAPCLSYAYPWVVGPIHHGWVD
jgi:ketosteroid isomerase-like protein